MSTMSLMPGRVVSRLLEQQNTEEILLSAAENLKLLQDLNAARNNQESRNGRDMVNVLYPLLPVAARTEEYNYYDESESEPDRLTPDQIATWLQGQTARSPSQFKSLTKARAVWGETR